MLTSPFRFRYLFLAYCLMIPATFSRDVCAAPPETPPSASPTQTDGDSSNQAEEDAGAGETEPDESAEGAPPVESAPEERPSAAPDVEIDAGSPPSTAPELERAPVSEANQPTFTSREYSATVKLSGRVVDAETLEPIVDASIYVFGTDAETTSDDQGRFVVGVPVGLISVAVVHPRYPTEVVVDVNVSSSKGLNVVVRLPRAPEVDDLMLWGKPLEGGTASTLAARRNSSTLQDALGSEDIAKTPDGSASAAARRIVGASVVGGQFLFVRGLGGRYSNVRLNGIPLPSTDPDLPGFQLDLFPTALLSSLTIAKTFTPDMPGNFAGGSLNVETRSFPETFLLRLNLGLSGDTLTTGRSLSSFSGGATDFLGFDDGSRALPEEVPSQKLFGPSRQNPEAGFPSVERDEIGKAFPNRWAATKTYGLPNVSLGASLGNTVATPAGDLGYFFTFGYRSRFRRELEHINSYRLDETGSVVVQDDFLRETTRFDAQLGSLGTVSYAPVEAHQFSLVGLMTQSGSDQARNTEGYSEAEGAEAQQRQSQFVERRLLFGQVLGKHKGLLEKSLDVAWQMNASGVRRYQPDSTTYFAVNGANGLALTDSLGTGEHLYSDLNESSFGGGLGVNVNPVDEVQMRAGYMGRSSSRQFGLRRFKARFIGAAQDRTLAPEELYAPENSGSLWRMEELSTPLDGFDASQALHAGYGMLDIPVGSRLRVIGGARREEFLQRVQARPPYEPWSSEQPANDNEQQQRAHRRDGDWLPALSVIGVLSEQMNVRGAYGATVARPELREVAPFASQDFIRRRLIQGNPSLSRTYIHNFDLRWEMFPSGTEVFAVSAFYKLFDKPIESVIINTGGDLSFDNIDAAQSYGAELEARWSLGALTPSLAAWSMVANLALIQSRIELSESQANVATTRRRPMAGQSPFIVNASLGYEPEGSPFSMFLYYNVFGRRIQDAGRLGLPDVYEEPLHQLDCAVFFRPDEHWVVSLAGANVLLQSERYTQGGKNFSRLEAPLQLSLNVAWTH